MQESDRTTQVEITDKLKKRNEEVLELLDAFVHDGVHSCENDTWSGLGGWPCAAPAHPCTYCKAEIFLNRKEKDA